MSEKDWEKHLAPLSEESRKFVLDQFIRVAKNGSDISNLKRKTPDLSERVCELEKEIALWKQICDLKTYHATHLAEEKELFEDSVQKEVDKQLQVFSDTLVLLNKELNCKDREAKTMKLNYESEIEKRDMVITIQNAKLESLNAPSTHILAVLANDSPDHKHDKYRVVRTSKSTISKGLYTAYKSGYTRELVRLDTYNDDNWGLIKRVWTGAIFNGHYATLQPCANEDRFVNMIRNCEVVYAKA